MPDPILIQFIYARRKHTLIVFVSITQSLIWRASQETTGLRCGGKQKALEYIQKHPWEALKLIPKKLMHFWDLEYRMFVYSYSHGHIGEIPRLLLISLFFLLISPYVFVITGALLHHATTPLSRETLLLLVPTISFSAIHSLTIGDPRFHFSLVPFFSLFASSALFGGPFILANFSNVSKGQRTLVASILLFMLITWSYGFYNSWDKWITVFSEEGHRSYIQY
jgi:hypothetical protein